MKRTIFLLTVLFSGIVNAEISVSDDWANTHPNATQIIQRINSEERRANNDYESKAITKDDYEHITNKINKQKELLNKMLSEKNGKDINREQNVYLNGQDNLIYNKTIQDVNNHQE